MNPPTHLNNTHPVSVLPHTLVSKETKLSWLLDGQRDTNWTVIFLDCSRTNNDGNERLGHRGQDTIYSELSVNLHSHTLYTLIPSTLVRRQTLFFPFHLLLRHHPAFCLFVFPSQCLSLPPPPCLFSISSQGSRPAASQCDTKTDHANTQTSLRCM